MKTIWLITFALTSAVLPLGASGRESAPPKDFRKHVWGAAPWKGLKQFSGPTDGVTMYVPADSAKLVALFDVPVAEEAYYFSHGKLYSGDVWLDGKENFDKMIVALTKEYGPPAFASATMSLWKWKWPNSPVEVRVHYQDRFARTTVTFVNDRY